MPSWKRVIVSGSDASLNSLTTPAGTINNITASYAITASHALNGGVTQLLAGPNVILSPTNGLGQVTVSATLSGSTIFNTATGSYGSFYDTTTQTNPVANIARSMSFNSTDITNGVSISGSTSPFNTYIKTENAGVYDIQFSAQVDKTDGGADEVVIWLRKNGTDLTDSATTLTLTGNNDKQVAAWNWFVSSATGDYYQIIWRSLDTDLRLLAEPISGTHPGIPSVIATVNRVDQFLSNTGSFNGSFTGTFTGSLQGTATTASYALTASYTPAIAGTDNYIPKFNGSSALENSVMYDDGTNIGIGTTNPVQKLHVVGSIYMPTGNIITWNNGDAQIGAVSGYNLAFSTYNGSSAMVEHMRITSAGNIGIGTTSPGAKLEVVNSSTPFIRARFNSTFYTDFDTNGIDFRGSGQTFDFKDNGNIVVRVASGGNVGIGTTSPSGKLEVIGANTSFRNDVNSGTNTVYIRNWGSSANAALVFGTLNGDDSATTLTHTSANTFDITNYGDPSSSIRFGTRTAGGTSALRMTIDSDGNVGIGTTVPLNLLHVSQASANTIFRLGNNASYDQFIYFNGGNDWSLGIDYSNSNAFVLSNASSIGTNDRLVVTTGGNVGIGTTNPGYKLDVSGDIHVQTSSTVGTVYFGNDAQNYLSYYNTDSYYRANGAHYFEGSGFYKGIWNADGNLGVGTTSVSGNSTNRVISIVGADSANLVLTETGGASAAFTSYANEAYIGTATNHPFYLYTSGSERMRIGTNGSIKFNAYGSGTYTGTATQKLAVDSSGNVIEIPIGAGPVDGSGTANYITRWSDTDTITTSSIYETGGNIGIGTTTPATKLVVSNAGTSGFEVDPIGGIGSGVLLQAYNRNTSAYMAQSYYALSHTFNVGSGAGTRALDITSTGNVGISTTTPAYKLSVVGKMALNDGGNSIFIGDNAGLSDDATANQNIAIGTNASQNNVSGSNNVAVGYNTLVNNTNINNTAVGTNALQFNTTALNNTAFGSFALNANTIGSSSIAVGAAALLLNTVGNHNTSVGNSALRSNISGSQNVGVGGSVMFNNANGNDNVALGWNAARYFGIGTSALTDTSGSIFIGSLARANASGETNQIVIGMNALGLGSNTVVLGNDAITTTALKGNVGIGTTNPLDKLHVVGNTIVGNSGNISPDSSGNGQLEILGNGYQGYVALDATAMYFGHNSSLRNLTLQTDETDRLTITGAGNVGIGTTNPATKLDVNGSSYFNGLMSINGEGNGVTVDIGYGNNGRVGFMKYGGFEGMIVAGSTTLLRLGHRTDNTLVAGGTPTIREDLVINAAGNVGIGTTNPGAKLDIVGTNSTLALSFGNTVPNNPLFINTYGGWSGIGMDQSTAGLRLAGDYSTGGNPLTDIGYYSSATVGHANWVSRLIVLNNGNVGIGITNPSYKLDVAGTFGTSGDATFNGTNTYINSSNIVVGNDSTDVVGVAGNTMYFPGNGNVGIGTTSPYSGTGIRSLSINASSYPVLSLSVAGTLVGSLVGYSGYTTLGTKSGNYLVFAPDDTERMRITAAGSVGIGTTNPGYKLDVNSGGTGDVARFYSSGATETAIYVGDTGNSGYSVLVLDSNANAGQIWKGGASYSNWGGAKSLNIYNGEGPIAFHSNNTANSMFLDTSGNLGIGTSSPTKKLHVASSGNEGIFMEGTSNGGHWFDFKSANSNLWSMGAQPGQMGWYNRTDSTYKMVITDAGDVLVGTTTSIWGTSGRGLIQVNGSSEALVGLTVNGTAAAYLYHDGTGLYNWNSRNGLMAFGTNNTERMRISAGGNVGIGTTSPSATLDVRSYAAAGATNAPTFRAFGYDTDSYFQVNSNSSNSADITLTRSDSATMFSINGHSGTTYFAGDVGIGITNPSTKLAVNGTAIANHHSVYANNYNGYGFWGENGGGAYSIWMADSATAGGQLTGDTSGNDYNMYFKMQYANRGFIFITGDNTSHFQITNEGAFVKGNIKLTSTAGSTSTPSYIWLGNDFSNGTTRDKLKVYLYNSGTEQYGFGVGSSGDIQYHSNTIHDFYISNTFSTRINSTGMGIGTSTPSQPLHVNGNIRVGGAYYDSNNQAGSSGQILSSTGTGTDWVSLSSISGVDGTGTANYVPKWTDADTIGNSAIYDNSGNIGIGTTNPGAKLEVVGTFRATTKSFLIDHPTKPTKKLQYGVLEGPEHSVYVRGKLTGTRRIELPDYWHALIHEDSITVNLTAIGRGQQLWVEEITDTYIMVGSDSGIVNCFYTVFAERKDVDKLITEFDKE